MNSTPRTTGSPESRPGPNTAGRDRSPSPVAWWGDRSVATKVLTAVGSATLVAGVIGVMGIQSLSTAADRTEKMYDVNVQGVSNAAAMRNALNSVRLASRDAAL